MWYLNILPYAKSSSMITMVTSTPATGTFTGNQWSHVLGSVSVLRWSRSFQAVNMVGNSTCTMLPYCQRVVIRSWKSILLNCGIWCFNHAQQSSATHEVWTSAPVFDITSVLEAYSWDRIVLKLLVVSRLQHTYMMYVGNVFIQQK